MQRCWLLGTASCRRQWRHCGPLTLSGHLSCLPGALALTQWCCSQLTSGLGMSCVSQNLSKSHINSHKVPGIPIVSFFLRGHEGRARATCCVAVPVLGLSLPACFIFNIMYRLKGIKSCLTGIESSCIFRNMLHGKHLDSCLGKLALRVSL